MKLAALGAFDGIHPGHLRVIQEAGAHPGIVFFEPVPKQYFSGAHWKRRLTTAGERYELLRGNGISSIITLPFDGLMATTSPKEFGEILAGIGLFDGYVVGYDFRYGTGASGTTETLTEHMAEHGKSVTVVDPLAMDSIPVKSGGIRRLVEEGDLQGAFRLLGRTYGAAGAVSRGKGLGRTLGFPTLNVRVPRCKLLPPAGSYAAFAETGCSIRKAVAFVVPEKSLIEVHVPGFSEDLYGAAVNVRFVEFIRKPERFQSENELKKTIKSDLDTSMEVLKEWQ